MRNLRLVLLLSSSWASLLLGGCGSTPWEGGSGPKTEAETALERGELDRALDLLERETERKPNHGPAWRSLAGARIRLAEEAIARGSSNLFVVSVMEDAAAALEKASALLPGDARTTALRARLEHLRGATEPAYELAESAKRSLPANASAELRYEVERTAAEASFQRYIALLQEKASVDDLAIPFSRTFRALRACEEARPADPWAYDKEADLFLWDGRKGGVVEALRRGVEREPALEGLHTRLVDYLSQAGDTEGLLASYRSLLEKRPEEPTTLWYQGLASIRHGDSQRGALESQKAADAYAQAIRSFEKSRGLRPDFAQSAGHYIALASASIGWCRYQMRKVDEAAQAWLETLRARPDLKDAPDGLGRTVKEGLGRVGGEYVEGGEFERGRQLFRALAEIDPSDADWMNNYAFLCREAGAKAGTEGKAEDARALFEESYAAYRKAVELSPEDPRIVNDCALVLLYHLDRDLDRAEAMFRRAAEIGTKALEAGAADFAGEALHVIVGDAHQNLGVLYFEKRKEPLKAKEFFRKSLGANAEARPRVQWYLNRIDQMEKNMRDWLLIWFPLVGPMASSSTAEKEAQTARLADELQKAADLLTNGQVNDALDLLDEFEKKTPDLPETNLLYGKAYVLKAEKLLEQGDRGMHVSWSYTDAIRYLERATQQLPEHGPAFFLLGKAYLGSNELERASAAAGKATRLMPRDADAFVLGGETAFQLYRAARQGSDLEVSKAEFQKALDSFQAAAKIAPASSVAWEKLGELYAWGGKEEDSKEAYVTAMGLRPSQTVGDRLLQRVGQAEWAKLLEKALSESKKIRSENDKATGILHWYLGYAHYVGKDMDKAREAFQRAASANPELLNTFYYLGIIHYDRKDFLAAADSFGKFAEKDPEGLARTIQGLAPPEAERLKLVLDYLEREAYGNGEGEVARALSHANAFLEPAKARRWNNYAFLCRETRRYEESYAAYQQAVEIEPENPQLLNDCALILQYHLHRDLDQAKAMYEKAIEKAKEILNDPKKGTISVEEARTALRDASSNLAKLKLRPKREGAAND